MTCTALLGLLPVLLGPELASKGLLEALLNEIKTLDGDMKAFKLIDRPPYDGYVPMRRVIKSEGGDKTVKPSGPPTV